MQHSLHQGDQTSESNEEKIEIPMGYTLLGLGIPLDTVITIFGIHSISTTAAAALASAWGGLQHGQVNGVGQRHGFGPAAQAVGYNIPHECDDLLQHTRQILLHFLVRQEQKLRAAFVLQSIHRMVKP